LPLFPQIFPQTTREGPPRDGAREITVGCRTRRVNRAERSPIRSNASDPHRIAGFSGPPWGGLARSIAPRPRRPSEATSRAAAPGSAISRRYSPNTAALRALRVSIACSTSPTCRCVITGGARWLRDRHEQHPDRHRRLPRIGPARVAGRVVGRADRGHQFRRARHRRLCSALQPAESPRAPRAQSAETREMPAGCARSLEYLCRALMHRRNSIRNKLLAARGRWILFER